MTAFSDFFNESLPYFQGGKLALKIDFGWERNDNHYLFTATWWFVAKKLLQDGESFGDAGDALLFEMVKRAHEQRLAPGLFRPFDSWDKPTLSHDEILGLALFDEHLAREIVSYGRAHWWFFNTRNIWKDTMKQWKIRFPTVISYLHLRSGCFPFNFYYVFAFLEFLIVDRWSKRGTTSGKCMRYIIANEFYHHGNAVMRFAAGKYLGYLEREYSFVGILYSIYFGPSHPLSRHTMALTFYK